VSPKRLSHYFSAATVGAVVSLLAAAGGTANERLHQTLARDAVAQQLHAVTNALRVECDRLFTAASAPEDTADSRSPSIAWVFDGASLRPIGRQPEAIGPITRSLSRLNAQKGPPRWLGPYPAADGRQFMIAVVPDAHARGSWQAVGVSLNDLLNRSGVDALMRAGIDISVEDLTHRGTLFRVRAMTIPDPVRVPVDLPGTRWEVDGEPHAGWVRNPLARWVLIALLGMGSGYGLFRLLDAPHRMHRYQTHLLARIDALNASLAEALRAQELAETQRTKYADIDAATGTASRRAFCESAERQLSRIRGELNVGLATIVVQFEQARAIATAFTHASLDEILREAAMRIASLPGPRATVGRVSDVELATWIDTPADTGYERTTQQIIEELSRPFTFAGLETHVSFAVGVSVTATGNTHAEDTLRQACAAAQEALSLGSAHCVRFESTTRERTITRLQLETDLRRSLAGTGLCLHYQPIVALDTRELAGFEALLRWQHPLEGLLSPGRFIPVAESAHLMLEIDRWVLQEAVAQLHRWSLGQPPDFFLSVNVSPQHFARRDLAGEVAQLLRDFKVAPQRLRLEVTESALISDLKTAAVVAAELRSLGIRICLDDFGTGYSSLNYLRSLPLDSLKVDRSFVDRMVNNNKDFGVVKTIIDLAHYLELTCIVEGVETSEQHELLQVLAPDFGQGFLYSQPITAERAEQLLRSPESGRRTA
jgi:EAL domain-containing protein (putative c-di-GMP-specific phosphodiesterase class I)/GGDEF domain-containing protein